MLHVTGLCEGIHRWPVKSPHKGPVTRKMFPFDDVIMSNRIKPYRIELIWENIKICLQFFKSEMAQIIEISPHVGQRPTYLSLKTCVYLNFLALIMVTEIELQKGWICTSVCCTSACYIKNFYWINFNDLRILFYVCNLTTGFAASYDIAKDMDKINRHQLTMTWWRHQVETFSALLVLCEDNSPVTREFPTKARDAVLRCFLWAALWIDGWVNNHEGGDLRRHHAHYDVMVMMYIYCKTWCYSSNKQIPRAFEISGFSKLPNNFNGIYCPVD